MHNPAFFLGLLAICVAPLSAVPLFSRDAAKLPGFDQPESVPIDLSINFPKIAVRDGSNIDAISSAARDALAASLKISTDEIKVSFAHTSTNGGTHHVHLVQVVDGIEITNAVANVNLTPDGKPYSVYSSFVPTTTTSSFAASGKAAGISVDVAVLKFAQSKGLATADRLSVKQDGSNFVVSGAPFAVQDIKASKKFYQKGDALIACWDLSVDLGYTWLNAFVSVASGEVVGVSDWSSDFSDASYLAVDPHSQAPTNSKLVTLKNPWNLNASPNGWHVIKGTERKDLYGNNVAAASNPNGSDSQSDDQVLALSRPSSSSLTFSYQLDQSKDAMNSVNINGAVTNMFVAANTIHDFFYNYGFTENAANFQFDNLGKGGLEGDGVIATCQDDYNTDSSSRNNANFLTPADGTSGRMRMYVFDVTNPTRDGAYDNGVVYHEMGHGLSNRLTGGGSNPNCLSSSQSGGMGEGWSDLWAVVLTAPATATRNTDIDMGRYVLGGDKGIRTYPYSTSLTTNPHKYSELKSTSEVHDVGEIWCTMLYEVLWNMVDVSGWLNPADLTTGKASGKGNADFASVVIQGMKNQPCNPSFIQARDAIIAADKTLFGGKYSCAIWKGFAKRGLGLNAKGSPYTNNADIPAECSGTIATTTSKASVTSTVVPTTKVTTSAVPTSKTTTAGSTCAHSICTSGVKLTSTCNSCVAKICAADSYCCTNSWDSICVGEVASVCNQTC
ncbi:Fungalysin metallopeptidase-domain-containing protein [Chytriomyces cf. hyalinus JEL632]|nr:Fungalysin metallopeptidase-domain-containing protein [Chytriomyces cf. hyalinus JEL632]